MDGREHDDMTLCFPGIFFLLSLYIVKERVEDMRHLPYERVTSVGRKGRGGWMDDK